MASDRVVRKTLADGSVKVYRYSRDAHNAPASIGALLEAYRRSAEWRGLRESTRAFYGRYHSDLDALVTAPVTALRRRDVLALRDEIGASRGHGAATAFVRTISALMSWAVDREWLEHSPALRVKSLRGGHLRAWTEAEYERALAVLPGPLCRAAILARHTGQRRGDLVTMPWSAYDGATVRLRQHKTGQALVIPASADLRRALDSWPRSAVPILTTATGLPWTANYLTHAVAVAMADAGMPGLSIHGLRKLAATSLAMAGCTIHEIAAVTGHESLAMVQLYTKSVQQEQLAGAAIVRLDEARRRNRLTTI